MSTALTALIDEAASATRAMADANLRLSRAEIEMRDAELQTFEAEKRQREAFMALRAHVVEQAFAKESR